MNPTISIVLSVVVFALIAGQGAGQDDRTSSPSWNREAAAKYLDDRMELWFAKAKKLRTGQTETSCVSCHTIIPYMLARPTLRKAMGVNAATSMEIRVIEETKKRVETYSDHEPLYDFDENKKLQSRGTEAVLNVLILTIADSPQGPGPRPGKPNQLTKLALERLWQTQRSDGGWDWLDFGLEPFESVDGAFFGATLAAFAVGTAEGQLSTQAAPGAKDANLPAAKMNPGIEKLRKYLIDKFHSQSLFNRTWLLLASTRFKDLLTKERRQALTKEIESRQRDDGGWSLETLGPWRWSKAAEPFRPSGTVDSALLAKSDGYATGLIVYTLRQAGLPADHPVVAKGLRWLIANQHDVPLKDRKELAWRTHSLNFDREHGGDKGENWRRLFMSDLATAFAVMALADSG
jgi:hypothetical protein